MNISERDRRRWRLKRLIQQAIIQTAADLTYRDGKSAHGEAVYKASGAIADAVVERLVEAYRIQTRERGRKDVT